jgi:hypothetical protein
MSAWKSYASITEIRIRIYYAWLYLPGCVRVGGELRMWISTVSAS